MNQESGGNPNAINLWDINARRGIPSKGLMQVIDPTFNAHAGDVRGLGVWNPFANIVASIRYANSRYGSAPRGWDRPGGYERGAWRLTRDEIAALHEGEAVISNKHGQADRFRERAMDALLNEGKGDGVTVNNHFNGITDVRELSKEMSKELTWQLRVAG
jgi:SLT domain-containing protein